MRPRIVWVALAVMASVTGCGSNGPSRVVVDVKQPPGIDRAKAIFKDYEKGEPVGSEEVTYGEIVEDIRKTDPAKADMVKQAFDDIKKGGDRKAKAKEVLGKL